MSDSEDDSQELARLLLRSARLDKPRVGARARALTHALSSLESPAPSRALVLVKACAALLAVAAGTALVVRKSIIPPEQRLQPEPPRATSHASSTAPPARVPELAPCPSLTVAQGSAPLIDDFEDGNARMLIADGREGTWMVYNDGSGRQNPPGLSPLHPEKLRPPRGESRSALHTSGGAFNLWGSVLVGTFTERGCYDASAYGGIEFWAKGTTRIYVQLSVIDGISVENGGLCAGHDCYPGPEKAFDLAPQWRKYELGFAELERRNQPQRTHFDPKRVVSINIGFHREDTPFDVWIDDVRFIAAR